MEWKDERSRICDDRTRALNEIEERSKVLNPRMGQERLAVVCKLMNRMRITKDVTPSPDFVGETYGTAYRIVRPQNKSRET